MTVAKFKYPSPPLPRRVMFAFLVFISHSQSVAHSMFALSIPVDGGDVVGDVCRYLVPIHGPFVGDSPIFAVSHENILQNNHPPLLKFFSPVHFPVTFPS